VLPPPPPPPLLPVVLLLVQVALPLVLGALLL
jgi:hypothetical protein